MIDKLLKRLKAGLFACCGEHRTLIISRFFMTTD